MAFATATVTFTNNATAAGTISIVIGSADDFTFNVSVASGDADTDIATAFETLVNADSNVPVSASATLGVVTLTAEDASGDDYPLAYSISGVQGTEVSLAGFSGNSETVDDSTVWDLIADIRYQTVVYPMSAPWDFDAAVDEFDSRFNAANNILDGVVFGCDHDSEANLITEATGQNSQSCVVIGNVTSTDDALKGSSILEFPECIAAQLAAIDSLRLTEGALTSDVLVGAVGNDVRGGAALASRPLFNSPFADLQVIRPTLGWSQTQIATLAGEGVTILGNNRARNGVIANDVVTTYQTDAAGNEDTTFHYLNAVRTSSLAREYFYNNLKQDFAQMRLTAGELVPNRPMANEASIRGALMGYYKELSEVDYALTVKGAAAEKVFAENLSLTIDYDTGSITAVFGRVPLVGQFRDFIGSFEVVVGL